MVSMDGKQYWTWTSLMFIRAMIRPQRVPKSVWRFHPVSPAITSRTTAQHLIQVFKWSGDSSEHCRAPDSWSKGLWFESWQERREDFRSPPRWTFCADSYFGIRSIPCVTAVARKRFRPLCQKCRLVPCMVYTERAPRRQQYVSRGTSHITAKRQRCKPLWWIFQTRCVKL